MVDAIDAVDVVCVASWNADLVSRVAGPLACGVPMQSIAGWRVADLADTIGAGDTFTGTLAASLSLTGRGAIDGMPSAAQVDAFIGTAMPSRLPACSRPC